MSFTYTERQELNALSKEVFGVSSFWYNKLYKKGVVTKEKNAEGKLVNKPRRFFYTSVELLTYINEVKDSTTKLLEEMKASQNGTTK